MEPQILQARWFLRCRLLREAKTVTITSPKTIRRVAVVGAGFFSQFHLDGWRQIPGIEIVGLCDPDLTKAQALANRFSVQKVYDSLETMLTQACPDLVDVVTPASSQSA